MDVDLFGRSQGGGVRYLCEFHKIAVASRLKVSVLIKHIPDAAGYACAEVSAHFSKPYRRRSCVTPRSPTLANRDPAAVPHAHDVHRALSCLAIGLSRVFVA
jgi:hypothetical protein